MTLYSNILITKKTYFNISLKIFLNRRSYNFTEFGQLNMTLIKHAVLFFKLHQNVITLEDECMASAVVNA